MPEQPDPSEIPLEEIDVTTEAGVRLLVAKFADLSAEEIFLKALPLLEGLTLEDLDFNRDGVVSSRDLSQLLTNFGRSYGYFNNLLVKAKVLLRPYQP